MIIKDESLAGDASHQEDLQIKPTWDKRTQNNLVQQLISAILAPN